MCPRRFGVGEKKKKKRKKIRGKGELNGNIDMPE